MRRKDKLTLISNSVSLSRFSITVIPAKAGIQSVNGLVGNYTIGSYLLKLLLLEAEALGGYHKDLKNKVLNKGG